MKISHLLTIQDMNLLNFILPISTYSIFFLYFVFEVLERQLKKFYFTPIVLLVDKFVTEGLSCSVDENSACYFN